MKRMKKVISIASALIMMLAMTATAFADATLSKEAGDNHTYDVYQIFKADSVDATTGELAGVKYGANSTGTEDSAVPTTVLEALAAVNSSSDAEKIAVIDDYWNQSSAAFATINDTTPTASLPTGYYLIKDTTTSSEGDSVNFHVAIVSDGSTALTITNKRDVPEVSKYIKEDSTSTYGKTADYSQGEEKIAFRIVGTLPDATNYARYQNYQYAFTDNMTNMTYVADSLTAKVYTGYTDENNLGTEYGTLDLTDSNVTLSASGSNISLAFADLKVATYTDATITAGVPADAVVVVEYNAKFTDSAVIGGYGNANSVKLTYSNDPNLDASGNPITTTEDTPEDYAYAFTYEFDGLKIDSTTNSPLSGAGFKIKDADGNYAIISAGVVTGWTETQADGTEILTGATGEVIVKGLDEGTYTLTETTVPDGYSAIADIDFTVAATISAIDVSSADYVSGSQEYKVETLSITSASTNMTVDSQEGVTTAADTDNGVVFADILNSPKSSLPSTGGIGTKLFYIFGSALMILAAIAFVVKMRFSRK